jgi:glutathione S-transferase
MSLILYGGHTSPYVRVVRVQMIQCALEDSVTYETIPTRVPESPLYAINPTGKIPTLSLGSGLGIGEARRICEHLDTLHTGAPFAPIPTSGEERALEGFLVGQLDGIAVWIREVRRPQDEQSPDIVAQEVRRAERCCTWLDAHIDVLRPATDYAMVCLASGLGRMSLSIPEFDWRHRYPAVSNWFEVAEKLPSIAATAPA